MQENGLTNALSFGLDIHEGEPDNLLDGALESRRVRNEANRLDKQGWSWDDINDIAVERSNHVKNTTQRIVDKALTEIKTYQKHKQDGWGRPYPYIDEPYPIRMNHGEGYALKIDESDGLRVTEY